ncbi:hypothetical protein HYC85_016277 [Camellia sinensis]|uniref:Uncharacterized protein n=1 Tax=Camellia sinensis TaxID=4442 RepID=A0A7J7GZ98_CAMSI|nr:hypothetical protein HYC85_016277 [Camellia sinensis]
MIYETSPSLRKEKAQKTEPGSQTEAKHKRIRKSGGKARSRDSETSGRARYATSPSAQSVTHHGTILLGAGWGRDTDVPNSDSVANSNSSECPLSRTLSEENLESLISSIDMSGQNLARPSGVSTNDFSRTPADHSISTSDLRLKLQLYKVRLLLLTRNLKAAKREVKMAMAMNVARGKDSSMALLLKSQLEYACGN